MDGKNDEVGVLVVAKISNVRGAKCLGDSPDGVAVTNYENPASQMAPNRGGDAVHVIGR